MKNMLAWTLECGNVEIDSPLSERTGCNETPSTVVCRNYHKINVFALQIEHCIGYAYIYGTIMLATILKIRLVKIRNNYLTSVRHSTEIK